MSATVSLREQRDGGLFGVREARSKREKCRAIARLSFGMDRPGIIMTWFEIYRHQDMFRWSRRAPEGEVVPRWHPQRTTDCSEVKL